MLAAAFWLAERDPKALMIVSATYHVIQNAAGFRANNGTHFTDPYEGRCSRRKTVSAQRRHCGS